MLGLFRFISVFLAFTVGMSITGNAASFDCSKATTETEIAICNDPELNALDELMGLVYTQVLRSNDWKYSAEDKDDTETINDQRSSISRQIVCGKNINCLREFYFTRIYELLQRCIDIEDYEGNPVSDLLFFTKYINSKTDIRSMGSDLDSNTTVLLISDANTNQISMAASGTLWNDNPIRILIRWEDPQQNKKLRILEGPSRTSQDIYVYPTKDNFELLEHHIRGGKRYEYSLIHTPSDAKDPSWVLYESNYWGVLSLAGHFTRTTTYHQTGVQVSALSYTFLDCEIIAQPTLIGDYNFEAIEQIQGYKSTYSIGYHDILDKPGLINFMQEVSDRELHLISVLAFEQSHFDIAENGFKLLSSRGYVNGEKNLQCVMQAIENN
jgi:uncharacterized protein